VMIFLGILGVPDRDLAKTDRSHFYAVASMTEGRCSEPKGANIGQGKSSFHGGVGRNLRAQRTGTRLDS
jgi:hypothetical protein